MGILGGGGGGKAISTSAPVNQSATGVNDASKAGANALALSNVSRSKVSVAINGLSGDQFAQAQAPVADALSEQTKAIRRIGSAVTSGGGPPWWGIAVAVAGSMALGLYLVKR
jgi:uncharacterized protein YukE